MRDDDSEAFKQVWARYQARTRAELVAEGLAQKARRSGMTSAELWAPFKATPWDQLVDESLAGVLAERPDITDEELACELRIVEHTLGL